MVRPVVRTAVAALAVADALGEPCILQPLLVPVLIEVCWVAHGHHPNLL